MEFNSVVLKGLVTSVGAGVLTLLGGVDVALKTLLLFIVLDYATGLIKAFINKDLHSGVGMRGIFKKVGILISVLVAHQMDIVVGGGNALFRNAVIIFFIANEGISLIENLTIMGVPIPKFLISTLKIWKEKADNGVSDVNTVPERENEDV